MDDEKRAVNKSCEYCIYNEDMMCRRMKDKLPNMKCLHYVSRFEQHSLKRLINETAELFF